MDLVNSHSKLPSLIKRRKLNLHNQPPKLRFRLKLLSLRRRPLVKMRSQLLLKSTFKSKLLLAKMLI